MHSHTCVAGLVRMFFLLALYHPKGFETIVFSHDPPFKHMAVVFFDS